MPDQPRQGLLTLRLTDRCNMSCAYCRQHHSPGSVMLREVLQRSLPRALARAGDKLTVVLTGGEPLLAPGLVGDTLDFMKVSRSKGRSVTVRLLTNGLLLDAKLIQELSDQGVDLQISCDGLDEAQREREPRTSHILSELLAMIGRDFSRYWQDHGSVSLVFSPATVATLESAVASLLDRGVPSLHIQPADGQGEWGTEACTTLERQLRDIAQRTDSMTDQTNPIMFLRPTTPRVAQPDDRVCGATLRDRWAVDVDGSWHDCSVLRASGHTQSLALIRRDERRSGDGQCRDCTIVGSCQVCPLAGDDPRVVPDAHCLFQRCTHELRSARAGRRAPMPDLDLLGIEPENQAAFRKVIQAWGSMRPPEARALR